MNFLRALASVGGITLASRVLGLLRDIAIARIFGAGAVTDAFFAAFRLPNTLRRFTAEGAFTQAFVPVYAARRSTDADAAARAAGEALAWLAATLAALSAAGVLFAPQVIAVLAPGLPRADLAAALFRIVFPYILFISLVALLAGMLNAAGKFAAAAAAPLLLNAALIFAALWWAPLFARPVFALAWGVFVGGALQLAWLVWNIRRAGLTPKIPRPRLRLRPSPEVRQIARLMWRGAIGAGAAQINLLINLAIASTLAAGSISWLYYADRLMELPVGIIGATLATVALPGLAARAEAPAAFADLLDKTLRLVVFLAAPAACGLALLALPLAATLFMHGAFSPADAQQTGRAALAYAAGVIALVGVRPLAAAFFARQDATIPVRAAFAALAATQACNGVLVFGAGWGAPALALSLGVGATVNCAILFAILRRRAWYTPAPGWPPFLGGVAMALTLMCFLLWWFTPTEEFWLDASPTKRALTLTACIAAAMTVYFATARLFGIRLKQFSVFSNSKQESKSA